MHSKTWAPTKTEYYPPLRFHFTFLFIFVQFCQISFIFSHMYCLAPKVTEVIKVRPAMSAAFTDTLEFSRRILELKTWVLTAWAKSAKSLYTPHNYPSCRLPQKNFDRIVFKWHYEFVRWILQFSSHMPSTNVLLQNVTKDPLCISDYAQHVGSMKCRSSKECKKLNSTLCYSTFFTPFSLVSECGTATNSNYQLKCLKFWLLLSDHFKVEWSTVSVS